MPRFMLLYTKFMITYKYIFEPEAGEKKEFVVELDEKTLNRIEKPKKSYPFWAQLEYKKCGNCPFAAGEKKFCPIATGLVDLLETFKDTISHHEGLVTVVTAERTISKQASMQEGLSSLIGIYMVTSACPVMEKLKPMVRYHLPFANVNETIYRATSMYLLGQYFVAKHNKTPDWKMDGLIEIYNEVAKLNGEIAQRIRSASNEDANINALVILDIFAKMLPFSIEDTLSRMEYLFASYLR